MSWWPWVELEVLCEFTAFSRAHRAKLEEAIDRATATGHDLDGMILPWAQRPDHARRAHAVRVLSDYHARKRPVVHRCRDCGAEYTLPIRRGGIVVRCPACRERRAA